MKITQILYKQHIGWHFVKHWRIQARKKPLKTDAFKALEAQGIPIYTPQDILKEERTFEKYFILMIFEISIVKLFSFLGLK